MSVSLAESISQLESLAEYCGSMINNDEKNIWIFYEDALWYAVKKLKGELSGSNAAEVIRYIMDKEDVKPKELVERMGCTRQNISQMLNRGKGDMRYRSFYEMTKALGYEIVIRKI